MSQESAEPQHVIEQLREELKQARNELGLLKANQKRQNFIYDTIGDIIFEVAVEGEEKYRFITANEAFFKAARLDATKIIGKMPEDVVPEPILSSILAKYKEAICGKKNLQWEVNAQYP